MEASTDRATHRVVVNHEQQCSIWPVVRDLPLGWSEIGYRGTREECLEHIEKTWTDMRPRSLLEQMGRGP